MIVGSYYIDIFDMDLVIVDGVGVLFGREVMVHEPLWWGYARGWR